MSPGPINLELNAGTASNKLKKILEMQESKFVEIQTDSWQREEESERQNWGKNSGGSSFFVFSCCGVLYQVGQAQLRTLAN